MLCDIVMGEIRPGAIFLGGRVTDEWRNKDGGGRVTDEGS